MNITKFTQNSQNSVNMSQQYAIEYGNQEIEQEHLLYALLNLDDSLILKLIEKMEIDKDHFVNRVKTAIEKRVKVSGGNIYVGAKLNEALITAENQAKAMGDDYVSVEHLFLAMLAHPNKEIAEIFKEFSKEWADKGKSGKRPESINIELKADGKAVEGKSLQRQATVTSDK